VSQKQTTNTFRWPRSVQCQHDCTHLGAQDTAFAQSPLRPGDQTCELNRLGVLPRLVELVCLCNDTGRDIGHASNRTLATDGEGSQKVIGRSSDNGEWGCTGTRLALRPLARFPAVTDTYIHMT
jgi:hypothetical protein